MTNADTILTQCLANQQARLRELIAVGRPYVWELRLSLDDFMQLETAMANSIASHGGDYHHLLTKDFAIVVVMYLAEWYKRYYKGADTMDDNKVLQLTTEELKTLYHLAGIDDRTFVYNASKNPDKKSYRWLESLQVLGGLAVQAELKRDQNDPLLPQLCKIFHGEDIDLDNLKDRNRDVARQSIKPLQEALARERQFTSYASHELRTPLAVIKGSLEVLIRKPRTQEEYERKIKENIGVMDNMNRMVDNMLMLTRADSSHFQLRPTDINIRELLGETCSAYSTQIIRKGLHITMNVTPEELTVNADRNALGIIVSNLISNATKYCDDGGEIKLSAYRQDGHTLMVFSNTGRGIPTEECEKVFDKFYRSISTGHQQVKGFGLGLAVVRRFAGLIGATVHFDSCPEGPTTVSVELQF